MVPLDQCDMHLGQNLARYPRTGCRLPPPDMPAPGIEPTALRLRDLRLARLSEPGTLCGCVGGWVRVCVLQAGCQHVVTTAGTGSLLVRCLFFWLCHGLA